jgi:hypothetical protein
MRVMRLVVVGSMVVCYLAAQSCSVYMHESRPLHKNVGVLEPGTDRSLVLQELGLPEQNYQRKDGGQVDVYKIAITSETTTSKVAWSGFHIVADALTLFLWEFVGTTVEESTKPEVRTYVVSYGTDNKIQRVASYKEGAPFTIPS